MAQQGRSVLASLVRNFINSLKPRQFRGDLVGKDHFGNTYYQILGDSRQKRQRWFEPQEKDNFAQELPAEWESWLRYRRKEPPLEEEVLANAALATQKKENAAKLESERKPQIPSSTAPPLSRGSESFPTYEEYEQKPGEQEKQRKL